MPYPVKGLADVTENSPNFFARIECLTESVIKFDKTNDYQKAFDILKAILKNEPVLLAPNFAKEILQKNLSWRLTLVILVQAVF